jgi:hypothetical protein
MTIKNNKNGRAVLAASCADISVKKDIRGVKTGINQSLIITVLISIILLSSCGRGSEGAEQDECNVAAESVPKGAGEPSNKPWYLDLDCQEKAERAQNWAPHWFKASNHREFGDITLAWGVVSTEGRKLSEAFDIAKALALGQLTYARNGATVDVKEVLEEKLTEDLKETPNFQLRFQQRIEVTVRGREIVGKPVARWIDNNNAIVVLQLVKDRENRR